ncbi:hypothetical protein ACFQ3C_16620 [Seohaeicola saemankumensis]|uniref:Uncharacterized protein n=1 Tax=Seohaeicola saemankumensis TaxID=481181 RepID=A0ABW3THE6_9RHOB
MNDLSGMFLTDPETVALAPSAPPDAPMAMPTQILEQPPRRILPMLLAAFRPARRPSREV